MYNTKVVCSYNTDEVFLETDKITDEERYFIRDAIYRQEVLDILSMDHYTEKEMLRTIKELYEQVQTSSELKECALKLAAHFTSTDAEFGLMVLFAYDYMYLTHTCISEYLETGKISQHNMKKLSDALV